MALRKQTLGGYKQNLVCTRNQEKGAMAPQKTDPDLLVSVQESPVEVWVGGGLLQGRGTEGSSVCLGPFEGGCRYRHHLHHGLVSDQTTEREHSPAHQTENWIKDLLSTALPIRTRSNFPSVSLSHQEACVSLSSFSSRPCFVRTLHRDPSVLGGRTWHGS